MANIDKELFKKYDVSGPRYTSYPTAPEWSNTINDHVYLQTLRRFGRSGKTLSLYIHIPFCQSLCSFCACSVVIRKQDDKYGDEYLKYLFSEIELVAQAIGTRKTIKQFHWGGGTPTYLNLNQIEQLFKKVQRHFDIDFNGEIAIEIDPRTIDYEKLQFLRTIGFNRISMGIQDFDHQVQEEINRIQPFEMVQEVNRWCRELQFQSVNFDLVYGLPSQTVESFKETVAQVIRLKPDRIALYSFAYVPWLKKHQSKISTTSLPSQETKLDIFLEARSQFLKNDYQAIAMDHFALSDDELASSFNQGKLYRNFMGYTVKPADEFIGLGVTAIGFLENTFFQNKKTLPDYYSSLKCNQLPIERGKKLLLDDQIRQWTINSLMCHFKLDKTMFLDRFNVSFDQYFQFEQKHIWKCIEDDLLYVKNDVIFVTELGKIFIRNICMGFDYYLRQKEGHKQFSKTV